MMNINKATASILASAFLWGTMGLFVKILSGIGFSLIQIVFVRTFPTALIMFLYLFITDRKLLQIRVRDLWMFFGTGIVSFTFFNLCYFSSVQLSSISVAVVLLYTAPVFVTLMSLLFFREKLTPKKCLAVFMTFLGCALVAGLFSDAVRVSAAGALFGIASGFFYALYSIFGRFALNRYHSLTVAAYTFFFAASASFALCSPGGLVSLPWDARMILLVLALSIVTCFLPFTLYTSGLAVMETGRAAITASVEPVVGALLGILIFSEPVTLTLLSGMTLTLCGIVILHSKTKKAK